MLLMPGLAGYIALVVINVLGGLLGIGMLLRYTEDTISTNREDPGLERKFDIARTGASVFVHGIKNQLLANRVLYKRIRAELEKPEPDMERLRESTERLNDINDTLIARSEELYRTVKSKSVMLVPTPLESVCSVAEDRFHKKYPDAPLTLEEPEGVIEASYRDRRYGVLSEVTAVNRAKKLRQTVRNEAFLARGGSCRRVVYVPSRSVNELRYTGRYQIEKSAEDARELTVTLTGSVDAEPMDRVELSLARLGVRGTFRVSETLHTLSASGETTELTLWEV